MKSLSIKAIILFVLCSTPQLGYSQLFGGLTLHRSGGNIVLSSISPYFVASVYDNNYVPYAAPTGPADLTTGTNPDGTVLRKRLSTYKALLLLLGYLFLYRIR